MLVSFNHSSQNKRIKMYLPAKTTQLVTNSKRDIVFVIGKLANLYNFENVIIDVFSYDLIPHLFYINEDNI